MFTKARGIIRQGSAGVISLLLAGVLVGEGWALAQGARRGGGQAQSGAHGAQERRGKNSTARRSSGPPAQRQRPGLFRQLRDLPPEEQEKVLAKDERFRRLPPERQEMIRERLRQWNALSPEEKEVFRQRMDAFENLTPAQRQEARSLFARWRELSPERRFELRRAFRQLRDLPPEKREQFLNSPGLQQRLSPEERGLLGGLGRLLPGPHAAADDESVDPESGGEAD